MFLVSGKVESMSIWHSEEDCEEDQEEQKLQTRGLN